ncbi:hypothetical protein C8R44DRAFT_976150 [Mycena epipterygia]|nr:hypothetical protein C8R44DRAFT_976150 [Mycena epipterygia]
MTEDCSGTDSGAASKLKFTLVFVSLILTSVFSAVGAAPVAEERHVLSPARVANTHIEERHVLSPPRALSTPVARVGPWRIYAAKIASELVVDLPLTIQ